MLIKKVKTQVQLEVDKNEVDLHQADKADNQKINLNDLLNRKKSEEKQKLKKKLGNIFFIYFCRLNFNLFL